MVKLSDEFRSGIDTAKSDIDALRKIEKKCRDFFNDFLSEIRCDEYEEFNLVWQVERYSLRLSAENGAAETWVATLEYDLVSRQLLYWDDRLAAKYPLPMTSKSISTIATYFGVSLGWMAHGSHLFGLPGVSDSFRIDLEGVE